LLFLYRDGSSGNGNWWLTVISAQKNNGPSAGRTDWRGRKTECLLPDDVDAGDDTLILGMAQSLMWPVIWHVLCQVGRRGKTWKKQPVKIYSSYHSALPNMPLPFRSIVNWSTRPLCYRTKESLYRRPTGERKDLLCRNTAWYTIMPSMEHADHL